MKYDTERAKRVQAGYMMRLQREEETKKQAQREQDKKARKLTKRVLQRHGLDTSWLDSDGEILPKVVERQMRTWPSSVLGEVHDALRGGDES